MNHNETLKAKANTSTRKVVNRLTALYNNATDDEKRLGADWYPKAGRVARDLSVTSGYSVETVAAVIAHLSPRCSWSRNVKGAELLLDGQPMTGYMSACVDRAREAILSDDPVSTVKGKKTAAFVRNILGDESVTCVDVWCLRASLGFNDDNETVLRKAGVYEAIDNAHQIVARNLGVSVANVQATCWTVIRGSAE